MPSGSLALLFDVLGSGWCLLERKLGRTAEEGRPARSLSAELMREPAHKTTEQHEGQSSSTHGRKRCLRCTVLVRPGCIQISRSPCTALTLSLSPTRRPAPSSK